MSIIKSTALLFLFMLSTNAAQAKVRLPAIFGDNAVLQRKQPLKVWGWTEPNTNVDGFLQGPDSQEKVSAKSDQLGKFTLLFKPKEAGGPYKLEVKDSESSDQANNMLFGEVWLCTGQSNLLTTLSEEKLLPQAKKEGFSPSIRFFAPTPHLNTKPEEDTQADWKILTEDSAENVPALAYFFAGNLQKNLQVPVGLLLCAAPGAKVQSLSRMQGLRTFKEGRAALAEFGTNFPEAGANPERLDFPHEVHRILIEKGGKEKNKEEMEKVGSRSYLLFKSATSIYNTMIAPVASYPMRGVLWYQGETNMREPGPYLNFFTGLVADWRKVWDLPKLPFLFVQMPPFGERSIVPNLFSVGAIFRNIQMKASLYPYTYMIPALDSCNEKNPNFHASNKKLLGERLCNAALDTQYGKPAPYRAPRVEDCILEGNKVRITFKYKGKGLKVAGKVLKGFAIAGGDKKLHWAQAKLDGDGVVIWSTEVEDPKIVTYGWDNNPETNLFSMDSLPVDPFREELGALKK